MELSFAFRNNTYNCTAFVDSSEAPCYIFVMFTHAELIAEFGDEISIKTDCEEVLPRKDDYPALTELREAIFYAIKATTEFESMKRKMALTSAYKNTSLSKEVQPPNPRPQT